MKFFLLSIIFIFSTIVADTDIKLASQNNTIEKHKICKDLKLDEIKQRGCCSWHGGVSGCSNGRIVCNDGSYSPSCTCVIPVDPLG